MLGDGYRFGVSMTARTEAGGLGDDIRFGLGATLETGIEGGRRSARRMRERARVRG